MTLVDMLSALSNMNLTSDRALEDNLESMVIFLAGDFYYGNGACKIWINRQLDKYHTTVIIIDTEVEYSITHLRRDFHVCGKDDVADDYAFASIHGTADKPLIDKIIQRLTTDPVLTYNEKIELKAAIELSSL